MHINGEKYPSLWYPHYVPFPNAQNYTSIFHSKKVRCGGWLHNGQVFLETKRGVSCFHINHDFFKLINRTFRWVWPPNQNCSPFGQGNILFHSRVTPNEEDNHLYILGSGSFALCPRKLVNECQRDGLIKAILGWDSTDMTDKFSRPSWYGCIFKPKNRGWKTILARNSVFLPPPKSFLHHSFRSNCPQEWTRV